MDGTHSFNRVDHSCDNGDIPRVCISLLLIRRADEESFDQRNLPDILDCVLPCILVVNVPGP